MTKPTTQIGIRLPAEHGAILAGRAEQSRTTPTSYARHLLIRALESEDPSARDAERLALESEVLELREELGEVTRRLDTVLAEMGKLRRDFHNGLLKLLLATGRMESAEVAEWAAKHLSPR